MFKLISTKVHFLPKNDEFLMHFFLKSKREPYAEIVQYTNRLYGDCFAIAEAVQFKSYLNVLNIWVCGGFFNQF